MATHGMPEKTPQYGPSSMRRFKLGPKCAARAIDYNGNACFEDSSRGEQPAGRGSSVEQPAQHGTNCTLQRRAQACGARTMRCKTIPSMAGGRTWSEQVDARCGTVDAVGATRSGQQHVPTSSMASSPRKQGGAHNIGQDETIDSATKTHTNEEGERGSGQSPKTLRPASMDVLRGQRNPCADDSTDANTHEVTQNPKEM